jgi:hypothetical protein
MHAFLVCGAMAMVEQGGGRTRIFDIMLKYLFQRFLDPSPPLLPYMVCLDHVFMFFTEYYTSHNRKALLM